MPQLRSFTGFAQAPQLAQSWASGVQLTQADQKREQDALIAREGMANQYNIASMENAARMAALAQQQQSAAMELGIKQQQLQMESMRAAQQLEVEKSYREQMGSLEQSKIAQQQQEIDRQAAEAARQTQAQAAYQAEVAALMKQPGVTYQNAASQAVAKIGPALGREASGALEAAIRGQAGGQALPPTAIRVKNEKGEDAGFDVWNTGNSFQLAPPKIDQPQAAPPGKLVWTDERGRAQLTDDTKWKDYERRISEMQKLLDGPTYEVGRWAKNRVLNNKGGKVSDNVLGILAAYTEKLEELSKLKQEFQQYQQGRAQAAPTASGSSSTNKIVIRAIRPAQR